MNLLSLSRRRFFVGAAGALGSLAGLGGCSTPLPLGTSAAPSNQPEAQRLLLDSAEAHGLAAYRSLSDISISHTGEWRPLIDKVQPVVVDKTYRGSSQDRLLPKAGVVSQAYTGSAGRKQIAWQRGRGEGPALGEVAVWYNDQPSTDPAVLTSSAVVAECYGLFPLGPLWLADRGLVAQLGGTERVDGRVCEVVHVWMRPGLGRVALDRVSLCIDRTTGLTRRLRFTLEGHPTTQGAVAEVDTFDHERRFGVVWPMRLYEEVVHPLRLPAHDWHLTGLDVNRGLQPSDVLGPTWSALAARPAAPL
ncbi:MAG: hypothetical protein V4739_06230 [Pseudomonadota bacterium]